MHYTDVLADWRSYFMPVRPVTLAFRAMHFGRYGSRGEDPRFRSIYLGYPELIRGYDNIQANECIPNAQSQCPVFDRLFGSRMIVGNVEVRAPLWGLFKGRLTYGPLPIEMARSPTRASPGRGVQRGHGGGHHPGNYYGLCGNDAQRPKLLGGQQSFLTARAPRCASTVRLPGRRRSPTRARSSARAGLGLAVEDLAGVLIPAVFFS